MYRFDYFCLSLKNKRSHINSILSIFLLCVFAIALTPWSSFHHHDREELSCASNGKICQHKFHIGNETHNCLVCSAHFEKDYYTSAVTYQFTLPSKRVIKNFALISSSYTALISLSLRGPPVTA